MIKCAGHEWKDEYDIMRLKKIEKRSTLVMYRQKEKKYTSDDRASLRSPIWEKGVMLGGLSYQCNGT